MLTNEQKALLETERGALRNYLISGGMEPLTFQRNDAYDMDSIVCASAWGCFRNYLRYMLLKLAAVLPCRLKVSFYRALGMKVGRDVCISPGVVIDPLFPQLIELEDSVCLGMGCRLLTHDYTATAFRVGRIHIGKGSVVGAYSTVIAGVTIGSKVTVGGMSFVNSDVQDGLTVGGVPAKPLKSQKGGQ